MTSKAPIDPILERFRASLREIYGNRLERAVLFGSRARGDAGPDSDYDIAGFLRDMGDRFAEMDRLADLATDILYDGGPFIHVSGRVACGPSLYLRDFRRDHQEP